MNTTLLSRLLATTDPQTVLYAVCLPESATVYTVRSGALYMRRVTTSGHAVELPQVSDRAAWARAAAVCAWTAPANPQTMHLGVAGARLGQFWAALPDVQAEQHTTAADLLAVVAAQ